MKPSVSRGIGAGTNEQTMNANSDTRTESCLYFVSYSGIKLPLNLVTPLEPAELRNRNTFFRAWYDDGGRLLACEKVTYGEVELAHRYAYHACGALREAVITDVEGEENVMSFDENGRRLDTE